MKLLLEERKKIVEYGKKMIETGLTVGTGGNISIFDREQGYMAISPSGIPYHEMQEEDVVIMDLEGNVVEGEKKPSSEHDMHSTVYRNRKDANAMFHTHALYATTIACLNIELPAVDYLVAHSGGKNIRCAEYASFGTKQLAENAIKAMEGRNAVLLANHGMNCIGPTIEKAFAITNQLEFCCRLYWQASAMGTPVLLSDEEMDRMVDRFQSYGEQNIN